MRFLVIEDEPSIARLIGRIFFRLGHEIRHVTNVADTKTLIKLLLFDGAFVDTNLGEESGYDIAPYLRERKIPIIAMSGLPENKSRWTELGAILFIDKPIQKHDVAFALECIQCHVRQTGVVEDVI